ncbi:MAG TPA: DUF2958 domain-containing protein [Paludibaculum sp.]|jgi:hypothetical protein
MKLLTSRIKQHLSEAWRGAASKPDPIVQCKFFLPGSAWTWYAISGCELGDGDWLFFGFVTGYEPEFGEFSLSELLRIKGPLGLTVERDLFFAPRPLSEIVKWSSFAA